MNLLRSPLLRPFTAALVALAGASSACGASVSATRDDSATPTDATASQDVTPPTPISCDVGQWCWQWPRPQGNPLNATLVLSARDQWAVGDRGTIVHYDGARWSQVRSPSDVDLRRLWGSGPNDVWAYGSRSVGGGNPRYALIHWDGARWQLVAHGALPFIQDLHGSGADNLWLATTGNDAAALLRWNGAAFVAAPALPDTARAQSVCARSPSEVWVTASDARNSWPYLLYRWDGASWTLVHRTDLPRGERFHSGVSCPADGVAIVGHFDFDAGVETYLEVRDGRVGGDALPLARGTGPQLFRTPHGDVYYINATSAVQWTERGWQQRFALPNSSVFSTGFDHLPDRSVGLLATATPFVATLSGDRWTPDPEAVSDTLSVIVDGALDEYSDPIAVFGGRVWGRPVGDRWSFAPTPVVSNGAQLAVNDAWGSSLDRVWLVGDAGAIARYDARAQTITPASVAAPTTADLRDVDGNTEVAWAVGDQGAVLRLEGERWESPRVALPLVVDGHRLTSLTLTAVDVRSDNDVMILGNDPLGGRFGSIFFRWNGSQWSASITFGNTMERFARDAAGDVFVVDGNEVKKQSAAGGAFVTLARVDGSVRAIRARGPSEIDVVTANEDGLTFAAWNNDRRAFVPATPLLTAQGASTISRGATRNGALTFWAVGPFGAVLRSEISR